MGEAPNYVKAATVDITELQKENADLKDQLAEKEKEVKSLYAFKRSVDEALNSGDGSYRP